MSLWLQLDLRDLEEFDVVVALEAVLLLVHTLLGVHEVTNLAHVLRQCRQDLLAVWNVAYLHDAGGPVLLLWR